MINYSITMKSLDTIKEDIEKHGKLKHKLPDGKMKYDEFGFYNCGCQIYGNIRGLCRKHFKMIEEMP